MEWRGLQFPLQVDGAGQIAWSTDVADIEKSIRVILLTRPGERVMRPDFGCRIWELAFEPADDTTAGLVIHYTQEALERWEPRIRVRQVTAEADGERSMIVARVEYEIAATGETGAVTLQAGGGTVAVASSEA